MCHILVQSKFKGKASQAVSYLSALELRIVCPAMNYDAPIANIVGMP